MILDLAGYTTDRDLGDLALLEPSCGHGAFLVAAVTRLMESARSFGRTPSSLGQAILSFDIAPEHVAQTKHELLTVLRRYKVNKITRNRLVDAWVKVSDFLLVPIDRHFDFVVGNPPYIRIEQLSPVLQDDYRRRYHTIYDRADLYVAFIERGLMLLSASGTLSFICADRWISNKYGGPLRELVSSKFRLRSYIDLHKTSPFESEVIAYPSIFVMTPGRTAEVQVATMETGSSTESRAISGALTQNVAQVAPGISIATYKSWFRGDEPWVLGSPAHLETLRELESKFEPIGTTSRIGIGVATGHDKTYIVDKSADIEPSRLVPLVMRENIEKGRIKPSSHFVINTFTSEGGTVDLEKYPRLKKYFEKHSSAVKKRHVAQKNSTSWFRTIDRVYPELVAVPKLLIPDIAGSNEIAFDEGHYHPHHNLYFITSNVWDMEVLGALLSSKVALFFVWSYGVKMRGGYLRFQAQYLRRIRLPTPGLIPPTVSKALKTAFRLRDFVAIDSLALKAYNLRELPSFDFVETRT
jgi:hypothetical protein